MCQFTDRFYSAVRTRAGDGAVKQRLLSAYKDNLATLPESDIPESIRAGFQAMRSAMAAAKPIGNECPVVATVRKMSAVEASQYANDIVAMFSELVRAKSTGERVNVVKTQSVDRKDAPARAPSYLSLN